MATSLVKLSDAVRQTSEQFPNKYNSNIETNRIPAVPLCYLILNPQTTGLHAKKIKVKRRK